VPITLSAGTKNVFVTYPSEKSVNLNESNNVSPLGTVSSGTWQGTTIGLAYGGTGQTTANAAFNALAPSQTGNTGKYLTTDGTNTSWATNAGGDVVGPASATANGIVLFDNTTGKLIKDSAASDGLIYGLTVGRGGGSSVTNTVFGVNALSNNGSGSSNVAIGYEALKFNTTSGNNIAIGYQALYNNNITVLAGSFVIGVVYRIVGVGTTNFTIIGAASNTVGTIFTATGAGTGSGFAEVYGAVGNTAVGLLAGYANTGGSNNTLFGYASGTSITFGSNNTFVGYNSGTSVTTGGKNVIIGSYTGLAAPISQTGNNFIVFSDGDANVRGTFNSSGNLGVGTTSPLARIHGSSTSGDILILDSLGTTSGAIDTGPRIFFIGSDGTQARDFGRIGLYKENGTSGNYATYMAFNVRTNGSTLIEPLRIDSTGNVGINTATPGSKLDVKGTLRLSGSTSGYVGLAPAAAAGSTTYTLPAADGTAGQALVTNGSGTLSFAGFTAGAAGSNTQVQYNNSGAFAGSANMTFNGTTLTVADLTDSSLTTGRVVYTTTGGNLTSSANLLYSGADLTVYGLTVGRGAGAVASNTAVGASALSSNTSSGNNVAVGGLSLFTNITGGSNTAVGYGSLRYSTGDYNTALGENAGRGTNGSFTGAGNLNVGSATGFNLTTGNNNTFVGGVNSNNYANAGGAVTSGAFNVLVGGGAGSAITSGSNNTSVGWQALSSNATATGSNNTALGYQAGYNNTTGTDNISIGRQSGYGTTTTSGNISIGYNTLSQGAGAVNSVVVGNEAQRYVGSSVVAVGHQALTVSTASNNTAVGFQSLYSVTTGNNTALGFRAGYAQSTGSFNVFVGYQAGLNSTDIDNATITGYGAVGSGVATGTYVSAYGTSALSKLTSGSFVDAFGVLALENNTSGSYNVAIGTQSLQSNNTGSNGTAVGFQALYTSGSSNNTAVGYQAGYASTGTANVFVGVSAGLESTSGGQITAVGFRAGRNFTTSEGTIAIGYEAGFNSGGPSHTGNYNMLIGGTISGVQNPPGFSLTSGGTNMFIGNGSGQAVTIGNTNLFVGWRSGELMTTGNGNTIVGRYSGNQGGLDIRTASNRIVLSDGDGNPRIAVNGGDVSFQGGSLYFRDPTNAISTPALSAGYDGAIAQDYTTITSSAINTGGPGYPASYISFKTGTYTSLLERVRISNTGVLDIGSSAGAVGQIQFPATQVASSNANTLDDYEEGSWTPTIGSTGGGTATYAQQFGTYTKVGRLVTVSFYLDFGPGTLAAGSIIVSGLPFNGGFNYEYGIARFNQSGSVTAPASGIVGLQLASGTSFVNVQVGLATGITSWTVATLDPNQDLIGTMTYRV
jgi:hypothetical protein